MARLTPGRQAAIRHFRSRRSELRLTQRDVAKMVAGDLSRRSLENFEAGRTWPHESSLQALSRAVGWHKDYLLEYAENQDSSDEAPLDDDVQKILSIQRLSNDRKLELIEEVYAAKSAALNAGPKDDRVESLSEYALRLERMAHEYVAREREQIEQILLEQEQGRDSA